MLTKHTKAPWFIHKHHITDKRGREIATIYSFAVYKDSTISSAEAEANANLIAESPELLKYAQELVKRIDLSDCKPDDVRIVKELKHAIKKAKGKKR